MSHLHRIRMRCSSSWTGRHGRPARDLPVQHHLPRQLLRRMNPGHLDGIPMPTPLGHPPQTISLVCRKYYVQLLLLYSLTIFYKLAFCIFYLLIGLKVRVSLYYYYLLFVRERSTVVHSQKKRFVLLVQEITCASEVVLARRA